MEVILKILYIFRLVLFPKKLNREDLWWHWLVGLVGTLILSVWINPILAGFIMMMVSWLKENIYDYKLGRGHRDEDDHHAVCGGVLWGLIIKAILIHL